MWKIGLNIRRSAAISAQGANACQLIPHKGCIPTLRRFNSDHPKRCYFPCPQSSFTLPIPERRRPKHIFFPSAR